MPTMPSASTGWQRFRLRQRDLQPPKPPSSARSRSERISSAHPRHRGRKRSGTCRRVSLPGEVRTGRAPLPSASLDTRGCFGPETPSGGRDSRSLALLRRAGIHSRGEGLHRRALAIRETAFGPEHPLVAASLSYLGTSAAPRSASTKRSPLQTGARPTRETLGREASGRRHRPSNLAELTTPSGGMSCRTSLRARPGIGREVLGARPSQLALALNNLAVFLSVQGKYEAAEPLYCGHWLSGSDFRPTIRRSQRPLGNMAVMYDEQSRYAESKPLHMRLWPSEKPALGPSIPWWRRAFRTWPRWRSPKADTGKLKRSVTEPWLSPRRPWRRSCGRSR